MLMCRFDHRTETTSLHQRKTQSATPPNNSLRFSPFHRLPQPPLRCPQLLNLELQRRLVADRGCFGSEAGDCRCCLRSHQWGACAGDGLLRRSQPTHRGCCRDCWGGGGRPRGAGGGKDGPCCGSTAAARQSGRSRLWCADAAPSATPAPPPPRHSGNGRPQSMMSSFIYSPQSP